MISSVLGYIASVLLSLSLSDSLYANNLSLPHTMSAAVARTGCQIEDVANGGARILRKGDIVLFSVAQYNSQYEAFFDNVLPLVIGEDSDDLFTIISGCGYRPFMRIGTKRRAVLSGAYLSDRELAEAYPEGVVFEVEAIKLLNDD